MLKVIGNASDKAIDIESIEKNLNPCPKCAEKDAEIEKINGFREKTKAQLRAKSDQVAELLNQRNQLIEQNKDLRARLDKAREALKYISEGPACITEHQAIQVRVKKAREALKEIGEK